MLGILISCWYIRQYGRQNMVVFVKSDFPVQTGQYSPNKSIKRRSFCVMSINVYAFINFQILNAFDKEIIHTEQILKHLINTKDSIFLHKKPKYLC